ncbi:MAG TPA: asparagine synthase (glutamine-hydrolyzing) [Oscillospiraceae bacterium]|nr:asparagine synthase (glutamine-hydrolyzing) [Oscillospiraceae bacterium]HPF56902.1 asparagine synthase (glutamine-hydrolyzing) [Clostridiales bacterium]HPK35458.1 asparagine synthase (glutamine-hydrolyzing) [Oscillospiraceae bacterium]HPR75182.1 asparagine synthase (glutamine-hydrolyzing) [Oscillospiraceae bacterium]
MCGIAGFCDFHNNFLHEQEQHIAILKQMRESIAHRGHDQTGEYLRENVGLAHTRLSIRDLSRGAQPMIRSKDGFEYAIVYNGEIYNAGELTDELKTAGYEFETTCDTEVILNAYIEYGMECVGKLNGIFAFAIWDEKEKRLALFRDHAGVKPLFYTVQNGLLVFGSELKALFAHSNIESELNLDGFREVFGIGPARTPGCGVFAGIYELEPGCRAVFNESGFYSEKYWDLTCKEHTDNYEKTVETVSFLVRDSITRQMISDVPVCSFLSGGVDSSIVTAVAVEALKQAGAMLNTYSFDFSGNDQYFAANSFQPERDRPYVDIMLSTVKTNHRYLECDERELAGLLGESMVSKDLPGMADIDASLMYFCGLVKRHNKVALTGECADEIFGGYPWFYREDLMADDGFPWSKNIATRQCLLQDDLIQKLDLADYVNDTYRASVAKVPVLPGETPEERRRREITYLNIKWFMQTLLDRMDRASMHSGLEARVPFADHRIMDYLFNVPWAMKRRNGIEKSLLRDAFKDVLPPQLLLRKKSPYPKTYNPNYERLLKEKLLTVISDANSPIHAFVDKKKAKSFLEKPAETGKPWFGQLMASPQLIAYMLQFEEWLRVYQPRILI